jgi:hypothetical protein
MPKINPYKSDVFTLGMNFLHLSTLESLDGCYDYSACSVAANCIDIKLERLKKN